LPVWNLPPGTPVPQAIHPKNPLVSQGNLTVSDYPYQHRFTPPARTFCRPRSTPRSPATPPADGADRFVARGRRKSPLGGDHTRGASPARPPHMHTPAGSHLADLRRATCGGLAASFGALVWSRTLPRPRRGIAAERGHPRPIGRHHTSTPSPLYAPESHASIPPHSSGVTDAAARPLNRPPCIVAAHASRTGQCSASATTISLAA